MEHQTEDFGRVPPDQVPEAYAAEPPFGAASDIVGESAGNPADIEGDLPPDADGELFPDAKDEPAPDGDDELFPEAGDGLAPDPDGELFADAEDGLAADPDDLPDVDDEPDVDDGYAWGIDADSPVDDAQEQPVAERGDEPAAAVDEALASLLAARQATGEPRVDAALARLDDLAGMPVTEHRAVFEDVHRRLRDVLGELDAGQLPEGAESRRGR
jgi:hypothetical protein